MTSPDARLDRSISIHALREEGDPYLPPSSLMHCAISIHALREEGDNTLTSCERSRWKFLSTPSARRATEG